MFLLDESRVFQYTQAMEPANRALYEAFGSLIRRKRRSLELTQDDLSRRLQMSRGALANIETGRQNILLHQLYRFAEALQMDVHDLLPVMAESVVGELPLPKNLTSDQKNQIARMFSEPTAQKKESK